MFYHTLFHLSVLICKVCNQLVTRPVTIIYLGNTSATCNRALDKSVTIFSSSNFLRDMFSCIQNRPAWATGGDNGASVNSAVNEYLAIDRDGNCT